MYLSFPEDAQPVVVAFHVNYGGDAVLGVAFEIAGRPIKAIYDGAWAEWGAREDLPVETGPAKRDQ